MRVNRGVIPLAKVHPPSCSKPTEMHFQLSYVKLWVYQGSTLTFNITCHCGK